MNKDSGFGIQDSGSKASSLNPESRIPNPVVSIQFYHLTTTPLERALPKLLEKAYAGGFKTLLLAGSDAEADQLNQLLWTYDPNSFLPHGSTKDGHPEQQPILIVTASTLPPRLRGGRGGAFLHGMTGENEFNSRNPEAMAHAKELRQNATDAEKKLWQFLQQANLGHSFRRQYPVGNYITDFACIEKKLIVELDGGQHSEQQTYDNERSEFLEKAGYRVLRFWNNDVMENIDGVLQTIVDALKLDGHPPSPPAGGGVKEESSPRLRGETEGGAHPRKQDFNLLAVTDGSTPPQPEAFERILDIFDGNDAQAVEKARTRWTFYKNAGHAISYLRQTESGGWEKAA